MSNSLLIAIVGGLGAMLGWGLADFFAKKTVDRIGDITSLVWAHLFGTTLLAVIVFFDLATTSHWPHWPHTPAVWLGLAFFGVLQMLVYLLVYKGFGKGQLAVLNPVFASYSGLIALVSILFLGERLSALAALALLAIFGGIMMLNLDLSGLNSKRLNIVPGLREVGLAALLAAFWQLTWDKFVNGQDFLSYVFLMYAFMSLAAIILAKLQKVDLKLSAVPADLWKFLGLIGLGEVVAYLFLTLGFSKTTHTSIVALLGGASSIPTVMLARLFLREKVTRLQEAGVAITIVGIILVTVR